MTDSLPTYEDMIAAGISQALAKIVLARRAKDTADAQRKFVAEKQAEEIPRILNMTADQEEAASRFMDDNADRYNGIFSPSDLWTIAYCAIITSHFGPVLPIFRPKEYPKAITLPCGFHEILAFAAKPSLSAEEAQHRADSFAQDALDLARQRYRGGFYSDPFTQSPKQRIAA